MIKFANSSLVFESEGGGNGGGPAMVETPVWHEQLDQSLKGNESLSQFKGVSDLAGKYLELGEELESLRGKVEGMVQMPGEDATEDEVRDFVARLGVPENPDMYEIGDLNIPDDMEGVDEFNQAFRDMAHRSSLLPSQAKEVYSLFMGTVVDAYQAQQEARQQALRDASEELGREWKQDFDRNVELSKRAARTFGGEDFYNWFEDNGLGNEPMLLRIFHKIGSQMADDTGLSGSTQRRSDDRQTRDGIAYLKF